MKRAMTKMISLVLGTIVLLSPARTMQAEEMDEILLGEACLSELPPDYEEAAMHFKRAGIGGNPEGYFRLGEMYEEGLLNVGNPCTDDLCALGNEKALQYYALAAQGGYEPAQQKRTESFRSISQEEARSRMEEEPAPIILDVRTQEEYDTGHIPGAICLPVESITEPPELLADFDQTILIYCRSGRRSKQAAQKLAAMGYTDVLEFGGILDWTEELVTKETNQTDE